MSAGEGGDRLEYRTELKFPLSLDELHELRYWHKGEGAAFRRVFPARAVNSLYFDSPDLASLFDNLAGVSRRRKYRLRWYGAGAPEQLRFEIKEKQIHANAKRIHELPAAELPLEPLISLSRRLRAKLPPSLGVEFAGGLGPTLFNRYRREYYEDNYGIRLTVDTDLEFDTPRRGVSGRRLERSELAAIAEVKFAVEERAAGRDALRRFPFRFSRSSKYVDSLLRSL